MPQVALTIGTLVLGLFIASKVLGGGDDDVDDGGCVVLRPPSPPHSNLRATRPMRIARTPSSSLCRWSNLKHLAGQCGQTLILLFETMSVQFGLFQM